MGSHSVPGENPAEFTQALRALGEVQLRPEVRVEEVPAPSRIAPYAVALTAEVITAGVVTAGVVTAGLPAEGDELASGRFVLLHDPSAPEPWDGVWRVVTFARAELEPELANDPALGGVGWSWLMDALKQRDAPYTAEGGTVTRVVSESFAALGERKATVEMEIRASWTPTGPDLGVHLQVWSDLLCMIAGLPPLPEGVVALPGRRH